MRLQLIGYKLFVLGSSRFILDISYSSGIEIVFVSSISLF